MPLIHPESRELLSLVETVASVCGGGAHECDAEEIRRSLAHLIATGFALDPRFSAPRAERYVMYPLYVADDGSFSLASAVWGPSQSTPVHDHGVWGVVGILSGAEHERRFERVTEDGPLVQTRSTLFRRGETTVCCTSDDDIHQVGCGTKAPCVGIHIYGGDIGTKTRHIYDETTGSARPFVSPWPWLEAPSGESG